MCQVSFKLQRALKVHNGTKHFQPKTRDYYEAEASLTVARLPDEIVENDNNTNGKELNIVISKEPNTEKMLTTSSLNKIHTARLPDAVFEKIGDKKASLEVRKQSKGEKNENKKLNIKNGSKVSVNFFLMWGPSSQGGRGPQFKSE